MRRLFLALAFFVVMPLAAVAQPQPRLTPPAYATLPTDCVVGDLATKTGSGAGLSTCASANTWASVLKIAGAGSDGQCLQTDGMGTLSWGSCGGGATFTAAAIPFADAMGVLTDDAAKLSWADATQTLTIGNGSAPGGDYAPPQLALYRTVTQTDFGAADDFRPFQISTVVSPTVDGHYIFNYINLEVDPANAHDLAGLIGLNLSVSSPLGDSPEFEGALVETFVNGPISGSAESIYAQSQMNAPAGKTINYLVGIETDNQASGDADITHQASLYVQGLQLYGAGTVAEAVGIDITGISNGGDGHITAAYGIRIGEMNVGDMTSRTIDASASTAPSVFGGTLQAAGYKSSDGSAGATVTTCTGFKNGLCVSGT